MADAYAATVSAPALRLPPGVRVAWRACGLTAIIGRLVVEARTNPGTAPAGFAARAQRTARAILDVHGVDVRAAGTRPDVPAILVANHLSYLDPLVVGSVAPCVSIAKGETTQWPLIGPGLRALGVIFVKRGNPHDGATVLRSAWRALQGGASVLNFPEGTTFDGRELGPFRRGIFGLARLAGAPILPVRISYDDDRVPWYGGQTFVPHYRRLARVPRVVARVTFGEPIRPDPSDDAADLAGRARALIGSLPLADR
jgi:1-acyl-sn-glycerol-3-phosphate acyltransferase